MAISPNTKPRVRYNGLEYIATMTASETISDGFYGTVISSITITSAQTTRVVYSSMIPISTTSQTIPSAQTMGVA